jgi:hypothetical protein
MMRPALLALLLACSTTETDVFEPDGFDPVSALTGDGAEVPRRGALTVSVTRMVPGAETTFTVTGAGPGEQVHIARTTGGLGEGPCLGTAGGLCLDITGAVALHASGRADALGEFTLVQTLPLRLRVGTEVWFQAVVPRGATGLSWIKSDPHATALEDASLTVPDMAVGDVVVSEVMARPSRVTDAAGEWFEVYNASGTDVNLNGLQVLTSMGAFTVDANVYAEAGDRLVLGAHAEPATNGGVRVDHAWGGVELLDSTWGELHISNAAGVLDSVAWDGGVTFPSEDGASMELKPHRTSAVDNDLGGNWCGALDVYGDGDLGTPGAENGCFLLPAVCEDYTELSDGVRHVDTADVGLCDLDDPDFGEQWYRFTGDAGTHIPTEMPPTFSCGTDAPGWMDGAYPTVEDGIVDRVVNFHWSGDPALWTSDIQVANCDDYHVFYLPPPPGCDMAFCGTD